MSTRTSASFLAGDRIFVRFGQSSTFGVSMSLCESDDPKKYYTTKKYLFYIL